ncbi:MAG: glycosyltransferase family 39 protein [Anaerolineae bacterium]|nr:glycosyltransferase family 39 protein [Anaerolineae bacterium]
MPQLRYERLIFGSIISLYILLGMLFAIRTPDWQAPDEPAHYNYIAQVVQSGCCPTIKPGDWDSAYLEQLKSARFNPELLGNLSSIQYENHQPPTYYLLASVVFRLTSGSLVALRLFSVVIGLALVLTAHAIACAAVPRRLVIALGTMAFVAFLPQHVAMLAAVNNDGLAELIVALTLWLLIKYLRGGASGSIQPWHLGILVGLGFLTKLSTYFMGGVVIVALLLHWWTAEELGPTRDRRRIHLVALGRSLALFLIPALLMGSIVWAANLNAYGFPDVFGQRAHNLVVADQPRTADRIAEVGMGQYLTDAFQTTFFSFWGQFGWMALPMQFWIYVILFGLVFAAGVGLIGDRVILRDKEPQKNDSPAQRHIWRILWLMGTLSILAYFYYNTEYLQLQGRYMFPGLIPMGIGFMVGIHAWATIVWKYLIEIKSDIRFYLPLIPVFLLVVLDFYLIWRVIPPGLAP